LTDLLIHGIFAAMDAHRYIACDLGAESGRVMLGTLAGGRVTLAEVHRFPSAVVRMPPNGSLRWDVLAIFAELTIGLRKVGKLGVAVDGISVDSWGVDYAVIGGHHPVLWPPFQYRDPRTTAPYTRLRRDVGEEVIFGATGIQFMPINTLYQLAADVDSCGGLLERADVFLTIGDYFNYLFSGVPCVDESLASTTQVYDPRSRQWSKELIERCGLPAHLFPRIVPPGTVLGPLLPDQATQAGVSPTVVASCSHDTGAAVAAVPMTGGDDWAYLSSGTWSLLGVELPAPLINDHARRLNFTNEAGFGGTTRFLKNIVGLWVLQELRRSWAADGIELDYGALTEQARAAEPFRSLIRPDDERFGSPGGMPAKVADFCRETAQPVPETPGQFARCVLESLALLYGATLDDLESVTGRKVARIHVVGGGSRSDLLNAFTAEATGRAVIAGPVEASAIGNVLVQAVALGHVASIAEVRAIVRASVETPVFQPTGDARWTAARARFAAIKM
jgi:rhamnulokinase